MAKTLKIVLFWVLGGVCLLFGSLASRSEEIVGLIISFILFLLGGLLWIAVATAVRKEE